MKKLLGDLWEWWQQSQLRLGNDRPLQGEMKPCPSYALLSVTGVAGLTILSWFGKEQSLLLWVMELSILCF